MTEARPRNSSTKVARNSTTSWENGRKGPVPDESSRLLHLREIEQEFGLTHYHVYRAVHEGHLHPLQRDGKGRTYYAEWEVKALARNLYSTLGAAA